MIAPHLEGEVTTEMACDKDLAFYRKAMRHLFALCQLWFAWKTGKKPPGLKEILG